MVMCSAPRLYLRLIMAWLCLLPCNGRAQMPQCSLIYYQMGRNIWNYDPRLPVSANNPVINTITPPAQFEGLAVSEPLGAPAGAAPTFYTTVGGVFYYYNGTRWINTNHGTGSMAAVNIAAGGGYLYNLVGGTGEIYRYDGTGDARPLTRVPDFAGEGPYDLIADCVGNWYLLNSSGLNSAPFLRKYDPAGNMLQSWTLSNPAGWAGNGGFAIIGNTIYYDSNAPFGIVTGNIGSTTVTMSNIVTFPVFAGAGDMASCASAVPVLPDVAITASRNNICSGDRVIFRAQPVNGGTMPVYQWEVNGVNTGANADSFVYTPANGDRIRCTIISSASCAATATATSNTVVMSVTESNLVPSVSIVNTANGFCDRMPATLTAVPMNGGPNPFYQWQKNGVNVGVNAPSYTDNALVGGDALNVLMSSNARCLSPLPVSSDTIIVRIGTPVVPGININTIPPTTLCAGAPITFLSNSVGGGPRPQYRWYRNHVIIPGATGRDYTDPAPADGDTVMVTLISSAECPVLPQVSSNPVGLTVAPVVTPAVLLQASPGALFVPGQQVTFTATPINGGAAPVYEWRLNNRPVAGAAGAVWATAALREGDVVAVRLESNAPCPSLSVVMSNAITMHSSSAVPPVAAAGDLIALYPNPNTGHFTVRLPVRKETAQLTVTNAIGQTTLAAELPAGTATELPVDLGDVAPGIYLIRLQAADQLLTGSFAVTGR